MINVIDPTPETSDQKVHTKDSSGYDTIFYPYSIDFIY